MSEDPRAVLLVEDNADDAELTIRGLKRANLPNPVDVARDGQEALDYLFGTGEQVRQTQPCRRAARPQAPARSTVSKCSSGSAPSNAPASCP